MFMFFASHTCHCTIFDEILENQFPFDHIPLNLLHSLSPYFIGIYRVNHSYIYYIIYCSTLNEIFIDYSDLKKNNFSKNDQSNLSSYHQISQLSSITKISERVVSTQLINYSMC